MNLEAWTDGSGTTGDRPAGIGVVVLRDAEPIVEASAAIGLGTNNIAEVRAIGRALALVFAVTRTRDVPVTIRSDSEFALGSVRPGSSWRVTSNPALAALVEAVRREASRWPHLRLEHVPGHAGHQWNERADVLAGRARKAAVARLAMAGAA
jgi:ribonuclease HI